MLNIVDRLFDAKMRQETHSTVMIDGHGRDFVFLNTGLEERFAQKMASHRDMMGNMIFLVAVEHQKA